MGASYLFSIFLDVAARLGTDFCLAFGLPVAPNALTHEFNPEGDELEAVRA